MGLWMCCISFWLTVCFSSHLSHKPLITVFSQILWTGEEWGAPQNVLLWVTETILWRGLCSENRLGWWEPRETPRVQLHRRHTPWATEMAMSFASSCPPQRVRYLTHYSPRWLASKAPNHIKMLLLDFVSCTLNHQFTWITQNPIGPTESCHQVWIWVCQKYKLA